MRSLYLQEETDTAEYWFKQRRERERDTKIANERERDKKRMRSLYLQEETDREEYR